MKTSKEVDDLFLLSELLHANKRYVSFHTHRSTSVFKNKHDPNKFFLFFKLPLRENIKSNTSSNCEAS